jgi:hypothetical protein
MGTRMVAVDVAIAHRLPYSFGGGLYCSACGTGAAAKIVVLIIIVLLVSGAETQRCQ